MTEQHDLVAQVLSLADVFSGAAYNADPWSVSTEPTAELLRTVAKRIEALESRQRVLREALEPFAKEAALWSDAYDPPPEDELMWIGCRKSRFMTDEAAFTLGDLRRARRALAGDAP